MVDTVVFLKVLIALSGCIIIISIMNYLIGNDDWMVWLETVSENIL